MSASDTPDGRSDVDGGNEFDYVIVGAGSAGCVLANRLSANPRTSVCLLEAGPEDNSPLVSMPLGMAWLFMHQRMNWRFTTTAQAAAGSRSIYTPRGKVLGGTSSINGMVYMRGHPGDYDDWAAAGNPGWSYREVLPYFLRSENNEVWRSSPFHGQGGPLNVTELTTRNPVSEAFVRAALELGIPECADFNGPIPEGVGFRQVTQRGGRRESAARAFLAPVRRRSNLRVITDALVDRVVFADKRARGVAIRRGDRAEQIRARGEVILCGGSIGSPQILLRSGVGAGVQLSRLGIRVLQELAGVGRNLQEHAAISLAYTTADTTPYGFSISALPRLAGSALQYLLFRRGFFASNLLEAACFVKSSPELARTDLQLSFMSARRASRAGTATQFGYGHGFGLSAILLRPHSRGEVRLVSREPQAPPAIDPNFFNDPRDLEILVAGLKLGRRIAEARPFAPYASEERVPGLEVQTDEALREFTRNNSGSAFHPVGTCAMGTGAQAVVDPQLRVHGLERLRVVDASIMPTIIGGNTNAPAIMIAEKAADLILQQPAPPAAVVNW